MQIHTRFNMFNSKIRFTVLGAAIFAGVVFFGLAPAAADDSQGLTDKEFNVLISTFNKSKTPQNAKVIFDAIDKSIDVRRKEGDYSGAIRLTARAMDVAKTIKSLDDYRFQDLNKALIKESKLNQLKEVLTKTIARKTNDKNAREKLIQIHLINDDDPEKAAALVTEDIDEELQKIAAAAKKSSRDLNEDELLMLAEWYYDNGKDDLCALKRAKGYFEQFLELHQKKDAAYLKANEALGEVRLEIGKMNPKMFIIPANCIWKPTIDVKKGQTLLITAKGTWYAGPRTDSKLKASPDGGLSSSRRHSYYLEGFIGNVSRLDYYYQENAFKIGSNLKMVVPADGKLYMQIHDYSHSDNCGEIVVFIVEG